MAYINPEHQKAAARKHYDANKVKMKARAREHTIAHRLILGDFVRKIKEATPCSDCGLKYRHYVMDFDHVGGAKEGNISDMVKQAVSMKRLVAEIAKCEIVCANCHRERTFGLIPRDST